MPESGESPNSLQKERRALLRTPYAKEALQLAKFIFNPFAPNNPIPLDKKRLDAYRDNLKRGEILVDREEQIRNFLPKVQAAFESTFAMEIGEQRIRNFFTSFDPHRILTISEKNFSQIDSEVTRTKETGELEHVGGFYHRATQLIFIKEEENMTEERFERVLLEELCHMFIDQQLSEKGRDRQMRKARGDYEHDPEEEIVKHMQIFLHDKQGNPLLRLLAFRKFEQPMAYRGKLRVEKIGWKKIFRGNFGPSSSENKWYKMMYKY